MMSSLVSLQGVRILHKEAQKGISGGVAEGGSCAAQSPNGGTQLMGVSRAEAKAYASAHGTHWCCDSCDIATWFDGDI